MDMKEIQPSKHSRRDTCLDSQRLRSACRTLTYFPTTMPACVLPISAP
ncbi:hypothetical protein LEMLEM_LOCUS7729 [Lemmus lemmus]